MDVHQHQQLVFRTELEDLLSSLQNDLLENALSNLLELVHLLTLLVGTVNEHDQLRKTAFALELSNTLLATTETIPQCVLIEHVVESVQCKEGVVEVLMTLKQCDQHVVLPYHRGQFLQSALVEK